jgi:hypothetical protein
MASRALHAHFYGTQCPRMLLCVHGLHTRRVILNSADDVSGASMQSSVPCVHVQRTSLKQENTKGADELNAFDVWTERCVSCDDDDRLRGTAVTFCVNTGKAC